MVLFKFRKTEKAPKKFINFIISNNILGGVLTYSDYNEIKLLGNKVVGVEVSRQKAPSVGTYIQRGRFYFVVFIISIRKLISFQ